MDILPPNDFIGGVQILRRDFLIVRTTRLISLVGWVLILSGCTATGGNLLGILPAKVATLEVQAPNPDTAPGSKDIICRIQMIDGVMVESSDRLKPGHHRLIVSLGTPEGDLSGDVDLVIPAAKDYLLKAEREDDTVTISLVEADTSEAVATSSALAAPVMSFQVFVIQK